MRRVVPSRVVFLSVVMGLWVRVPLQSRPTERAATIPAVPTADRATPHFTRNRNLCSVIGKSSRTASQLNVTDPMHVHIRLGSQGDIHVDVR